MRWNLRISSPPLILVVVAYLLTNSLGYCQQTDDQLGRQRGEADAMEMPLLGSTFLMPWTLPVSADSLLGRSSEYLGAYLEAYASLATSGKLVRSLSGSGRGVSVRGDRAIASSSNPGSVAPPTDADLGRQRARADAHPEAKWLGLGIVLPGIALFMPLALPVRVPQNTLLGRSPEYLDAYLDAYVGKVRLGNLAWAALGTGVDLAVVGGIAAATAAAESCCWLTETTLGCIEDPLSCLGPFIFSGCSFPF